MRALTLYNARAQIMTVLYYAIVYYIIFTLFTALHLASD